MGSNFNKEFLLQNLHYIIGQVNNVKGEVIAISEFGNGKARILKNGMNVFADDLINTSKGSMELSNNAQTLLQSNMNALLLAEVEQEKNTDVDKDKVEAKDKEQSVATSEEEAEKPEKVEQKLEEKPAQTGEEVLSESYGDPFYVNRVNPDTALNPLLEKLKKFGMVDGTIQGAGYDEYIPVFQPDPPQGGRAGLVGGFGTGQGGTGSLSASNFFSTSLNQEWTNNEIQDDNVKPRDIYALAKGDHIVYEDISDAIAVLKAAHPDAILTIELPLIDPNLNLQAENNENITREDIVNGILKFGTKSIELSGKESFGLENSNVSINYDTNGRAVSLSITNQDFMQSLLDLTVQRDVAKFDVKEYGDYFLFIDALLGRLNFGNFDVTAATNLVNMRMQSAMIERNNLSSKDGELQQAVDAAEEALNAWLNTQVTVSQTNGELISSLEDAWAISGGAIPNDLAALYAARQPFIDGYNQAMYNFNVQSESVNTLSDIVEDLSALANRFSNRSLDEVKEIVLIEIEKASHNLQDAQAEELALQVLSQGGLLLLPDNGNDQNFDINILVQDTIDQALYQTTITTDIDANANGVLVDSSGELLNTINPVTQELNPNLTIKPHVSTLEFKVDIDFADVDGSETHEILISLPIELNWQMISMTGDNTFGWQYDSNTNTLHRYLGVKTEIYEQIISLVVENATPAQLELMQSGEVDLNDFVGMVGENNQIISFNLAQNFNTIFSAADRNNIDLESMLNTIDSLNDLKAQSGGIINTITFEFDSNELKTLDVKELDIPIEIKTTENLSELVDQDDTDNELTQNFNRDIRIVSGVILVKERASEVTDKTEAKIALDDGYAAPIDISKSLIAIENAINLLTTNQMNDFFARSNISIMINSLSSDLAPTLYAQTSAVSEFTISSNSNLMWNLTGADLQDYFNQWLDAKNNNDTVLQHQLETIISVGALYNDTDYSYKLINTHAGGVPFTVFESMTIAVDAVAQGVSDISFSCGINYNTLIGEDAGSGKVIFNINSEVGVDNDGSEMQRITLKVPFVDDITPDKITIDWLFDASDELNEGWSAKILFDDNGNPEFYVLTKDVSGVQGALAESVALNFPSEDKLDIQLFRETIEINVDAVENNVNINSTDMESMNEFDYSDNVSSINMNKGIGGSIGSVMERQETDPTFNDKVALEQLVQSGSVTSVLVINILEAFMSTQGSNFDLSNLSDANIQSSQLRIDFDGPQTPLPTLRNLGVIEVDDVEFDFSNLGFFESGNSWIITGNDLLNLAMIVEAANNGLVFDENNQALTADDIATLLVFPETFNDQDFAYSITLERFNGTTSTDIGIYSDVLVVVDSKVSGVLQQDNDSGVFTPVIEFDANLDFSPSDGEGLVYDTTLTINLKATFADNDGTESHRVEVTIPAVNNNSPDLNWQAVDLGEWELTTLPNGDIVISRDFVGSVLDEDVTFSLPSESFIALGLFNGEITAKIISTETPSDLEVDENKSYTTELNANNTPGLKINIDSPVRFIVENQDDINNLPNGIGDGKNSNNLVDRIEADISQALDALSEILEPNPNDSALQDVIRNSEIRVAYRKVADGTSLEPESLTGDDLLTLVQQYMDAVANNSQQLIEQYSTLLVGSVPFNDADVVYKVQYNLAGGSFVTVQGDTLLIVDAKASADNNTAFAVATPELVGDLLGDLGASQLTVAINYDIKDVDGSESQTVSITINKGDLLSANTFLNVGWTITDLGSTINFTRSFSASELQSVANGNSLSHQIVLDVDEDMQVEALNALFNDEITVEFVFSGVDTPTDATGDIDLTNNEVTGAPLLTVMESTLDRVSIFERQSSAVDVDDLLQMPVDSLTYPQAYEFDLFSVLGDDFSNFDTLQFNISGGGTAVLADTANNVFTPALTNVWSFTPEDLQALLDSGENIVIIPDDLNDSDLFVEVKTFKDNLVQDTIKEVIIQVDAVASPLQDVLDINGDPIQDVPDISVSPKFYYDVLEGFEVIDETGRVEIDYQFTLRDYLDGSESFKVYIILDDENFWIFDPDDTINENWTQLTPDDQGNFPIDDTLEDMIISQYGEPLFGQTVLELTLGPLDIDINGNVSDTVKLEFINNFQSQAREYPGHVRLIVVGEETPSDGGDNPDNNILLTSDVTLDGFVPNQDIMESSRDYSNATALEIQALVASATPEVSVANIKDALQAIARLGANEPPRPDEIANSVITINITGGGPVSADQDAQGFSVRTQLNELTSPQAREFSQADGTVFTLTGGDLLFYVNAYITAYNNNDTATMELLENVAIVQPAFNDIDYTFEVVWDVIADNNDQASFNNSNGQTYVVVDAKAQGLADKSDTDTSPDLIASTIVTLKGEGAGMEDNTLQVSIDAKFADTDGSETQVISVIFSDFLPFSFDPAANPGWSVSAAGGTYTLTKTVALDDLNDDKSFMDMINLTFNDSLIDDIVNYSSDIIVRVNTTEFISDKITEPTDTSPNPPDNSITEQYVVGNKFMNIVYLEEATTDQSNINQTTINTYTDADNDGIVDQNSSAMFFDISTALDEFIDIDEAQLGSVGYALTVNMSEVGYVYDKVTNAEFVSNDSQIWTLNGSDLVRYIQAWKQVRDLPSDDPARINIANIILALGPDNGKDLGVTASISTPTVSDFLIDKVHALVDSAGSGAEFVGKNIDGANLMSVDFALPASNAESEIKINVDVEFNDQDDSETHTVEFRLPLPLLGSLKLSAQNDDWNITRDGNEYVLSKTLPAMTYALQEQVALNFMASDLISASSNGINLNSEQNEYNLIASENVAAVGFDDNLDFEASITDNILTTTQDFSLDGRVINIVESANFSLSIDPTVNYVTDSGASLASQAIILIVKAVDGTPDDMLPTLVNSNLVQSVDDPSVWTIQGQNLDNFVLGNGDGQNISVIVPSEYENDFTIEQYVDFNTNDSKDPVLVADTYVRNTPVATVFENFVLNEPAIFDNGPATNENFLTRSDLAHGDPGYAVSTDISITNATAPLTDGTESYNLTYVFDHIQVNSNIFDLVDYFNSNANVSLQSDAPNIYNLVNSLTPGNYYNPWTNLESAFASTFGAENITVTNSNTNTVIDVYLPENTSVSSFDVNNLAVDFRGFVDWDSLDLNTLPPLVEYDDFVNYLGVLNNSGDFSPIFGTFSADVEVTLESERMHNDGSIANSFSITSSLTGSPFPTDLDNLP